MDGSGDCLKYYEPKVEPNEIRSEIEKYLVCRRPNRDYNFEQYFCARCEQAALYKTKFTEEDWKIAYKDGTEEKFNNKYHECNDDGLYKSAATGEILFHSKDKFDDVRFD